MFIDGCFFLRIYYEIINCIILQLSGKYIIITSVPRNDNRPLCASPAFLNFFNIETLRIGKK